MQHLEGSGTPVLYIGRTVLKGYISASKAFSIHSGQVVLLQFIVA